MKQKLLLSLTGMLMAFAVLMPSVGIAQSATSTAQLNAISALLQQVQAIQGQIDALKASQKTLKSEAATQIGVFVTNLSLGSQGDDVKALQALLSSNSNIYPEGLITGYFGKATERALKRLQKENGLEQAGRVGPKTLKLLNRILGDNPIAFERDDDNDNASSTSHRRDEKENKRACAIVPPGHLIAPGWLKKNDGVRPIVPPCQTLPKGIEKKLDGDWKPNTTTPDTVVPTINDLNTSSISTTTAYVSFVTSEDTISTLWYGTTTPITNSSRIDDVAFRNNHLFSLSSLFASTTYYYIVNVSDHAHNSATSTERSFVTLGN